MAKRKVAVVGAGPGGLTAAMLLASKGYDVDVFEKQPYLGGRNAAIEFDGFTFDLGPTFLMMKFILEEMFELSGRNLYDYLEIKQIDPLYRLVYGDGREFHPSSNREQMAQQLADVFPGNYRGYLKFLEYEEDKFRRLVPCLQIPYSKPQHLLKRQFLQALPILDAHLTLFSHLGKYFKDDDLRLAFTFQAKYLGMSPWKCPGTFSIISFIEHTGGIHHPIGGLNKISHAMAQVIEEEGGRIHLQSGVKQVIVRGDEAVGVELENGESVQADYVVMNADFGYAVKNLFPSHRWRKYSPEKLKKKGVSCSGFMLYLAVDRKYDIPHHNIIFANDYAKNIEEIAERLVLSEEPSIYIQNAGITDSTLAPEGKSAIYILVPIANNRSGIDWEQEKGRFREKVLTIAEERGGLTDLRQHIIGEQMITPLDFEQEKFVYDGAIFNLAHTIDQMLLFRPNNEFEDIRNCYLVGGGTHPGSGLPTIYESGRISAGLIMRRDAWYL
jgi:phytoene desaturase